MRYQGSKMLYTTLCISLLITGLLSGIVLPLKTHAQFATFESNPLIVQHAVQQTTKESILDGIAWTVAKVAVQSMTRSIVNWINSGYQGSPAFSQNLNRDLRQMGDAVASIFIAEATSAVFSSEFIAPLARDAVATYYLLTSEDRLAQRLKYTLADYALDSAAYIRGDWSRGGLSGWYGLTFRCENDPTCVSFVIQEDLFNQIDAQTRRTLAEFNAGRGFLSWRGECSETAGSQAANTDFQQCVAANERGGPQQDCFALYGGTSSGTTLSDANKCVAYDVLTPGAVVEQTLVESLGSPIRQLELADSINEIISAVVVQMVNSVLGGGGLFGLSSPQPSGGGRPIDIATTPSNTTISTGFETTINNERQKWVNIQDVALAAQQACPTAGGTARIIRTRDIVEAIRRSGVAIEKLDEILALLVDEANLLNLQQAQTIYQELLQDGTLSATTINGDPLLPKIQEYLDECT